MSLARSILRRGGGGAVLAIVLMSGIGPAQAQNKKKSWEVFIYFGGFFANEIPQATQRGVVTTYRVVPAFAADPNDINQVYTPNIGLVGGDQTSSGPNDPTYNYPFVTEPGTQFGQVPCQGDGSLPGSPGEFVTGRGPYYDECDQDQEGRYLYNASGIVTNGEIQVEDAEFMLGLRAGYNITSHWEIEMDIGFGKQRLDLTRNTVDLLNISTNDISHPMAAELARFYQFTYANIDWVGIVPTTQSPPAGPGEHPNVISSRKANDPNYNIPLYFPVNADPNYIIPQGETFEDVTGFANRVFVDPTAWRNRGNQINIDTFTLSGLVTYNFNTKADSRFVPYLSAGYGRWFREFDDPYQGEDTDFLTYGGGIRFFVNEIFSFRMDVKAVTYMEDSFTIDASVNGVNLKDRPFEPFANCARDQREWRPPLCQGNPPIDLEVAFPNLGGGGGNASIEVDAELDDFYEFRIGFDVILGGK